MVEMTRIHSRRTTISQTNICTIMTNLGNTINARLIDGVALVDTVSASQLQDRGNDTPSLMGVGPRDSSWSRSAMVYDHNNHLIQGNNSRQPFQSAAHMPYLQASNVNGYFIERTSTGLQRSHHIRDNRSGLIFPQPPPINPQYHRSHHLTLPFRGMRNHSINFHPLVTADSYRDQINSSQSAAIPTQNAFEMATRHVGPAPSAGLMIYQPRRGGMPEITFRHGISSPTGFLQVDGERNGNVSSGLLGEMITSQMKKKIYVIPANAINLEEAASEEQDTDLCIICQDEYKNGEKIGVLQCSHEFHADCLKKWLLVKNFCPLCRSEALTL